MRAVMTLMLGLALTLGTSGCWLDEIDKSVEALSGPKKKPKVEAKENAPATPASGWQSATSLGNELSDESIVSCKLGDSVQFMSRDDCLSKGGKVD